MHTDTYIHRCLQSPTGAPQPQKGKHVGLVALRYRFCEKYEGFMLQEHLVMYRFWFCWCLTRWHNEHSNPQVCTSMEDGKWDGIFVVVKNVISKIIFP